MDLKQIEILKGQDHVYWLYNNETDKYTCTDIPWSALDEDEFAFLLKMCPRPFDCGWVDDLFDA